MTRDFLDLMKNVADRYGIKITENAEKGGIFYRDEQGKLQEVPAETIKEIINTT